MALIEMLRAGNSRQTQLVENIATTDQNIKVSNIDFFPQPPNYFTIGVENDAEVVRYSGLDQGGGMLTGCLRGQSGTVSKSWGAGAIVYHSFTSNLMNGVIDNINTLDTQKAENPASIADGQLVKWDEGAKRLVRAGEFDVEWKPLTLLNGVVNAYPSIPAYTLSYARYGSLVFVNGAVTFPSDNYSGVIAKFADNSGLMPSRKYMFPTISNGTYEGTGYGEMSGLGNLAAITKGLRTGHLINFCYLIA